MKLFAEEDVALSADRTWSEIARFEAYEALLAERGAVLVRTPADGTGLGTQWAGEYPINARATPVSAEIVRCDPPQALTLDLAGGGLGGALEVGVAALSADTCRVSVSLTFEARSLPGRLLLQPMKLGHAKLEQRLADRLAHLARGLEAKAG